MSWLYSWGGLNDSLFLAINHAGAGGLRDHVALWGTMAGNHALFPFYAAGALALALKRPATLSTQAVLVFLVAYLIDWGVIAALKPWLDFPRPLVVLGPLAVHVVGSPEFFHSFPSGHTAFAFTLLAGLAAGASWPLRGLLAVFALWVAWSRIAVGAHFPADVVGGALIGIAAALVADALLRAGGWNGGRR